MTALEIAVQDVAGIGGAARARADRIELCSALAIGGVTPSAGLVAAAVDGALPVHVLVRPRGGGFEYDDAERRVIVADAAAAVAAGARGVVVGGTRGGLLDADLLTRIVEAAGPAEVTFHRAFDALPDSLDALDELADLGVTRVLTSGGPDRAVDALDGLAALVAHAGGRVQIMAGGGVAPDNVRLLLGIGLSAVHASARGAVQDVVPMRLGSASPAGAATREALDEAVATALARIVHGATA